MLLNYLSSIHCPLNTLNRYGDKKRGNFWIYRFIIHRGFKEDKIWIQLMSVLETISKKTSTVNKDTLIELLKKNGFLLYL